MVEGYANMMQKRQIFKIKVCSIFIVFSLWGCTAKNKRKIPPKVCKLKNLIILPVDIKPLKSIHLSRKTVYKDTFSVGWYDKGIPGFGWFGGMASDASGRVYIADFSSGITIHVFSSEGRYLKDLGRKGNGPGEFQSIADMRINDNRLYALDSRQYRINVYSLDSLAYSHIIQLKPFDDKQDSISGLRGWFIYKRFFINKDTMLAMFMKHPRDTRFGAPTYNLGKKRIRKFYFMNADGKIISNELFEQRGPKDLIAKVEGHNLFNVVPLPFLGRSLRTISGHHYIYTAWSEDFLIKAYNPAGHYLHAFYVPFRKRKLVKKNILKRFDKNDRRNRSLVKHADLPETWPALNSLTVDEKDRLWISTIVENDSIYQWWVLDKQGKLLARFKWPKNRQIELVKNGSLYIREVNDHTGLQKVIKYKFEMD